MVIHLPMIWYLLWLPVWRRESNYHRKNHDYELFTQALTEVCAVLSRKIAKDGEGQPDC